MSAKMYLIGKHASHSQVFRLIYNIVYWVTFKGTFKTEKNAHQFYSNTRFFRFASSCVRIMKPITSY